MNFVGKSYYMKRIPMKKVSQDESAIRVLSKRVGLVDEVLQEILLKMDRHEDFMTELTSKVNKIYDKVHERPEHYTVGQIALKEGVSEKLFAERYKSKKYLLLKEKETNRTRYLLKLITIP